jgi:4-nitrophenyl phosphatase
VFVLGERGIEAELDSLGIPHIGGSDSSFDRVMKPEDFDDIASEKTIDKSVGAVVVGMDMNVNYLKLSYVAYYL